MTTKKPLQSNLRLTVVFAAVVLLVAAIRPVRSHLRAAGLLLRFADEHATGVVADFGRRPVTEELTTIHTEHGEERGRLYLPDGAARGSPGVVVVHGVHRLGIDEPRLIRFARAIAATGLAVLTPEVREIADYRVDPRSIETIGGAARALEARLGSGRPGVMGMSFAGGLSLLAAGDPRFKADVGFVVAVGAHHDLGRVARFFATDREALAGGGEQTLKAHQYGALVLVYGSVERFFAPDDVPAARDALRLWLWEKADDARARAEALSPEGWAKVDALFSGEVALVAPEILAEAAEAEDEMARVSPHGHLADLAAPVFLLHGEGDTVIPAAETGWIAAEVPPRLLKGSLVSPAVVHVELGPQATFADQWALVHFMASVLEQADLAWI